jgi:uncharacterized protein (TIGR00159 family)
MFVTAMWESAAQFWAKVRFVDFIDVAVISVLLYLALRWLRNRANAAAAAAAGVLTLLYVLARRLDMYLTLFVFQAGFTAMLVVMVLVFQADIRRAFERLAVWRPWRQARPQPAHQDIDVLTETAARLSQDRCGALIVVSGDEPLEHHIRGGIPLGGQISMPLLLSIFQSHSPGHDGAMIVEGGRVERFGVHLPLSENPKQLGRGGTRHAAALGMAERSDALVIVVSEETGRISVAWQGKLNRLTSPAELKAELESFFALHAAPERRRPWYGLFTRNLGLKFGSLLLALLLWLAIAFQVDVVQRTYLVPVDVHNRPDDWTIEEQEPTEVRLTLSGPERAIRNVDKAALSVSLDFAELEEGYQEVYISDKNVTLPKDVTVAQATPPTVSFSAYRTIVVEVPVKLRHLGRPAAGFKVVGTTAQPATVKLRIRQRERERIREITASSVDVTGQRADFSGEVTLQLPPHAQFEGGTKPRVTALVRIQSTRPM